jgi:signal peptidase
MMLKKVEGSKGLNLTTYILFVILDITTVMFYTNFTNGKELFEFISLTLLPAISTNFAYIYISKKVGIVPVIIYSLVMSLYIYLIPISPDANEFLTAILKIVLPVLLMNRVNNLFEKVKRDKLKQDYKEKNYVYLLIPTIFTILVIYFTSGYFHFSTLTIASGSMSPKINKGDVIVIEKVENKDNISIGDVVVYSYNGTIIVHRLVDILKLGEDKFYYTKGDNNESKDSYVVTDDMIIGIAKVRIPFIGMPTLWLNGL